MVGDTVKFTIEQSAWTFYHQNFGEKIAFNRVESLMKKTSMSGVEADKQDRAIFPLSLAIKFLWVFWLLKAQENLFSSNLVKTSKHTGKSSNNWKKKKKGAKLICFQGKKPSRLSQISATLYIRLSFLRRAALGIWEGCMLARLGTALRVQRAHVCSWGLLWGGDWWMPPRVPVTAASQPCRTAGCA